MIIERHSPPKFTADWADQIRHSWPGIIFPRLNRSEKLSWLEVGSFEGRSALWTVENMFDNPESRITCIDTWVVRSSYENLPAHVNYNYEEVFDANVKGIEQIIKRKGFSRDVLPTLEPHSFHGCYLDGSHKEEDVIEDAHLVLPLLRPGAPLIFDDYKWDLSDSVRRAVDRLLVEWGSRATVLFKDYQLVVTVAP